MISFELDGEVFEIKQRTTGLFTDCKFSTGYYLKNTRTGTLIVESTVDKVKEELIKVSKENKIYAKKQLEDTEVKKMRRW